jgi:hypothetical protein
LQAGAPLVKAPPSASEPAMIGIAAIAIFLVVMCALNFYEFGRLD